MHVIEVLGKNALDITEGTYRAEDVNAGEMLSRGWCRVRDPGNLNTDLFSPHQDWNGNRILFVRPGGFGDLLFLTPTFAEIKRRWPEAMIYVACFDRFKSVLENNPDVTGFIAYPVPVEVWNDADAHVWLEGIIEQNAKALTVHAVDLIADRCGLELTDKKMRYVVTQKEMVAAECEFPRTKKARIGFQMSASSSCRMYPHMQEVSRLLWKDGNEIFLFGRPGEMSSNETKGVVNLMSLNKTFRESCAILSTCDVVVAPDSALVHVAGALDIPCVAVYGPFPWTLRTKYAPQTFAIQGVGKCSPCFHHQRPGTGVFPEDGPCFQTSRCEVLATIPVERVVREVQKKLSEI